MMIMIVVALIAVAIGAYMLVSKYVSEEIRIMNEIESR